MKFFLLLGSLLLLTACNNSNVSKEEKKEPSVEPTANVVVENTSYSIKQLELKRVLDNYLKQLEALNTEGIIEMTYPKLFIPINKDLFIHYINTLLTSPQISVDSFSTNISSLGKVYPFGGGDYAEVKYLRSIQLSFVNPDLYRDDLSIRVLKDVLSRKYGSENIQIDAQNRTITIKEVEKLLAIKEGDEEWKFIGDNPSYRRLYPRIIPSDILSQI